LQAVDQEAENEEKVDSLAAEVEFEVEEKDSKAIRSKSHRTRPLQGNKIP